MRTKWMSKVVAALAGLALLGAPALSPASPRNQKGAPAKAAPQQQKAPGEGVLTGKVLERLDGGGYAYLRIAQPKGDVWAAVPAADVKVGQEVTVDTQALMGGFESKALGRKFDQVYFGMVREGATQGAPAAGGLPPGHPAAPAAPAAGGPAYADAKLKGKVLEVLQVPSYTYLRLSTPEGETWAAVPTADVAVGAQVGIHGPSAMDGFESKSLKRKFDRIFFGTLSVADAQQARSAGKP